MDKKDQQFESLVRSFYQPLFRYAYWQTKDKEVSEDLVQETFSKAWKNLHKLENLSSAKPWLFTILNRENARRFSRKQIPIVDQDEGSNFEEIPDLNNEIDRIPLERAIKKLPIEYREPLVLQVVAGFTTQEISRIMTLNSNTVSTRLHRARAILKNSMQSVNHKIKAK